MDWKKAIGLGLLMWVIMFALWSLFMAVGIAETSWIGVVAAIIAAVIGFALAKWAKPKILAWV